MPRYAVGLALLAPLVAGQQTTTNNTFDDPVLSSLSISISTTTLSSADSIITSGITGSQCPNGQLNYNNQNGQYCCPGAVYGQDDSAYCCVGADFQVATPSFADCFPFCSGSTSEVVISSTTQQSCRTTIPLTASDYSSLAAAAASETGSGSGSTTATTTGSGSSPSGESAGSSESDASSAGGSDSGNAAGAIATGKPLAGAIMVAGGLLMAL